MQITNNFNNINNVNFQAKKKKEKDPNKVGFKTMALAYMGGSMANFATKAGYQFTIGNTLINSLSSKSSGANMGETLKQAIKVSGLDRTGLEFIDFAKLPKEEAFNISKKLIKEEAMTSKLHKFFFKNPLTRVKQNKELEITAHMLAEGSNAGVLLNTNKMLVHSDKIGSSGFHEIGHLMNKNFSKIGRTLQKLRTPMALIPGILLTTALLTNKRSEDNKPQNFWQKTTAFIKNNVGKLTALTFVPTIAEEIMASSKGLKLAKKMPLPKEQLKQVAKTNIIGALSYIGAALAVGFAAKVANNVRDGIVEKRQAAKAAKAAEAQQA